jgi:hypothetical protein
LPILLGQGNASTVSYNVDFKAVNQSMWGTGSANIFNASYFAGASWDEGAGGNYQYCVLFACAGVSINGSTNGQAGTLYTVTADSGSVNASQPGKVQLVLPSQLTPGQNFTVGSTLDLSPGSLQTSFPNFSLSADLILDAHASLSAQVCLIVCTPTLSTGDLIGLDQDIPLYSYNLNDDNKLQVLGVDVPKANFGDTINLPLAGAKLGDVMINNPDLQTSGGLGSMNFPGPPCFLGICFGTAPVYGLYSTGEVDLLTGRLDILNLGLEALDLPPLSGSIPIPGCDFIPGCSLGLDVAEMNVGAALGIQQEFLLTNTNAVNITLHVEETGQTVTFQAGGSASLYMPDGYSTLHIDPTFSLAGDPTLFNRSSLTVNAVTDFNMLKACLGGCLGPVFKSDAEAQVTTIYGYDSNFPINFGSVQGPSFQIGSVDAPAPVPPDPTPEPGTWMLAGGGLIALLVRTYSRRRKLGAAAVCLAAAALSGCSHNTVKASAETGPLPKSNSGYYAVLLNNGQAYFGKLQGFGTPYPVLREVYYVQTAQNKETKDLSHVLIRRGKEVHAPDWMLLNGNDIVYVEPVSADSKVAQLIEQSR